uniref:Uncharacterized protein n=1 Tax=Sus scrofa TaxID=9823 RepID=A0A8D0VXS5_PIG
IVIRRRAAIFWKPGASFSIEEIEVALPKAKEVRIKGKKITTFPHQNSERFTVNYMFFSQCSVQKENYTCCYFFFTTFPSVFKSSQIKG